MKHAAILALIFVLLIAAAGASIAAAPGDSPQVASLKKQLRSARGAISDQQVQIAAQNDLIATQTDTIARLRARDPLDAITARDPDGLWQAMRAIWLAFPANDPATFCGYDKSATPGDPGGLSVTVYSFLRTSGC